MRSFAKHPKRGFTLLEAALAMGIMTIIGTIVCGVWVQSLWSFDRTTSQTVADTDAVIAMQRMIADVREAKSFQLISDNHLRIFPPFPVKNPDGSYNRVVPDLSHPVDYLQSDDSGLDGRTGTWLWRKETNGVSRPVVRDIESVVFESETLSSVRITVVTKSDFMLGAAHSGDPEKKSARTRLTERVVYLRNY